MKSAIILNLLATIFLFGIGDASKYPSKDEIDDLKSTMRSTVSDLVLYHKNLTSIFATDREQLNTLFQQFMEEMVNNRLRLMKMMILFVHPNEPKEADECIKSATDSMRQIPNSVDIVKCGEPARAYLKSVTEGMKLITQFCDTITDELNQIIMNCDLLGHVKLQECISSRLYESRNFVWVHLGSFQLVKVTFSEIVQRLVDHAESLKKTDDSIPKESDDCRDQFWSNFHATVPSINLDANKCSQNITLQTIGYLPEVIRDKN